MSAEAELVSEIIDRGYWGTVILRCIGDHRLESLEVILRGAKELNLSYSKIQEAEAAIKICKGV